MMMMMIHIQRVKLAVLTYFTYNLKDDHYLKKKKKREVESLLLNLWIIIRKYRLQTSSAYPFYIRVIRCSLTIMKEVESFLLKFTIFFSYLKDVLFVFIVYLLRASTLFTQNVANRFGLVWKPQVLSKTPKN